MKKEKGSVTKRNVKIIVRSVGDRDIKEIINEILLSKARGALENQSMDKE